MEVVHISAAALVKSTLKAKVYRHLNPAPDKVTEGMKKGQSFEDLVIEKDAFREMRGTYLLGEDKLHFSWDSVEVGKKHLFFTEVKMNKDETTPAAWYVWSTFAQVAFYSYLTTQVDKLVTATFARERFGDHLITLDKGKKYNFRLIFGDYYFEIEPSKYVFDFYHKKALQYLRAISQDNSNDAYTIAGAWDGEYKHKEWKLLKNKIKYFQL